MYGNNKVGMNGQSSSINKDIVMSVPLLMRLFEYCHENAESDIDLHNIMEKIIMFSDGTNPLNMDSYEIIINDCCQTTPTDVFQGIPNEPMVYHISVCPENGVIDEITNPQKFSEIDTISNEIQDIIQSARF